MMKKVFILMIPILFITGCVMAPIDANGENFKSIINYEQDTLLNLEYELMTNEHIELLEILTKEQFEQMSYKVGE